MVAWEDDFGRAHLDPEGRTGTLRLSAPLPWSLVAGLLDRWVLPAALRLRGCTVLHASAVEVGEHAIAFAGPSGSGKSTLAGELAALGHPLLADDYICLSADRGEKYSSESDAWSTLRDEMPVLPVAVRVFAGDQRLRLRPDAWERLRSSLEDAPWLLAPDGKLLAGSRPVVQEAGTKTALPLGSLFLLGHGRSANPERLEPARAVLALLRLAYGPGPREPRQVAHHFRRTSSIARLVPVWTLPRTDNARRDALAAVALMVGGSVGWDHRRSDG